MKGQGEKHMKKVFIPSIIALGLIACSENQDPTASQTAQKISAAENAQGLWAQIHQEGVANYFEDNGILHSGAESMAANAKCDKGLRMDENTLYLDEMEGIYKEGTLIDGVCGKAVSLASGEVAPLSINLIDPMPKGTVEFWFKPGKDFFDNKARTLLGNDESRVHFFVKDGQIVFQKNHADIHYFAMGEVKFVDGWNKIAGQWGDGFISVWVNDSLVAKKEHKEGYEPSRRGVTFGNLLVIGYKSECCMEGPGQYASMTTSGAFDQVRISNIPRYKNEGAVESSSSAEAPVTESSSSSVEEIVASSSSVAAKDSVPNTIPVIVENDTNSVKVDSNGIDYEFFEDFDGDTDYNITLDEGVSGKAANLKYQEMVQIFAVNDSIPQGTFEFEFKPGKDFDKLYKAALVGSDEGRLTILKVDDQLVFYKNLADTVISVSGKFEFKDGWNKIAGQWDGKSMSLYVNGELIGTTETSTGYSPSTRNQNKAPYGNAFLVGYKTFCCTTDYEGGAYTSGSFDNILVTTKLLY